MVLEKKHTFVLMVAFKVGMRTLQEKVVSSLPVPSPASFLWHSDCLDGAERLLLLSVQPSSSSPQLHILMVV